MYRYVYPDDEDRITAEFITSHEPYPGYWAESEAFAFEKLEQYLAGRNVLPDVSRTVLDVGSGEGRLLPWFRRFASLVTAQDLDSERLDAVKRSYGKSVNYIAGSVYDLPDSPFDMVVCSHVLQHVSTDECTLLLSRMRMLTKPSGLLVLLFSRAPAGHEEYRIATLGKTRLVDEVEFNSALKVSVAGQLPFRLFDPEKLKETARRLGWVVDWEWTFHIIEQEDRLGMTVAERDGIVNEDPSLSERLGRDMMMVWRRDDS